ncbi:MAG: monofunctional biosynthetic peptidoglycan transglycosylase [Prevotella sp.]|nr:monofunctional biosynthetic peptidoglycan transglycosylase [Prevotella sp.]
MLKLVKKTIRWIVVAFFASTILSVVALRFIPVWFTPLMFIRCYEQARDGRELKMSHHWVPLSRMSADMPVAVIASEDGRFYSHHGFDFKAIESAARRNITEKGKNKLGGSTITQQTAKNVFLWPGRSWLRKGLEAYFTMLIELTWTKERILEVYLNSIEMGEGIYGAEAVAQEHFRIPAEQLTESQCALIAATLPNPRRFSSLNPSSYVKKRQRQIVREMRYVRTHMKDNIK